MEISAVLVVSTFTGLSDTARTWWTFFAICIGMVVKWVFTVCHSHPLIHNDYLTRMIDGHRLFILYIPWLSSDDTLWQLPLFFNQPISDSVFLSVSLFRPSLPLQSLEIWLQRRRSRNVPTHTEDVSQSRFIRLFASRTWICVTHIEGIMSGITPPSRLVAKHRSLSAIHRQAILRCSIGQSERI